MKKALQMNSTKPKKVRDKKHFFKRQKGKSYVKKNEKAESAKKKSALALHPIPFAEIPSGLKRGQLWFTYLKSNIDNPSLTDEEKALLKKLTEKKADLPRRKVRFLKYIRHSCDSTAPDEVCQSLFEKIALNYKYYAMTNDLSRKKGENGKAAAVKMANVHDKNDEETVDSSSVSASDTE